MKRAPDPRRLLCYESRDRAAERLRRERAERREKRLTVILVVILIVGLLLLADAMKQAGDWPF